MVCVSPKRRDSRALNTPPMVLWSTIHMHHEGGNTWAIRRTYNGYTTRRSLFSPVSRMPSLNLNVYVLRGGDAARYNAPTSDARRHSHLSTLAFESEKAMLRGDCANSTISTFRKRDYVVFIENMRRSGRLN